MAKKHPKPQDARHPSNEFTDLVEYYQKVFSSPEGKIVLFDLMRKGYFLSPTMDKASEVATQRNEGQREMILYILEMVGKDPEKIFNFIKEQEKRREDYYL